MKDDIKKLIGWADYMTGGVLSAEDLEQSLKNGLAHREPKELEPAARRYRKRNQKARLRIIEVYIFENSTFELT
jgi:hypothetical protein